MQPGSSKPLSLKLEKYEPIPMTGCWLWLGAVDKDGYGVVQGSMNGAVWRDKAHRKSYELHHGPIPAGLHVLHHCDQPGCIAPHHIFLGDPKLNAVDRTRKGRTVVPVLFGPANPRFKG